ncbi:MAG: Pyruvate kinase [Pseudomonadota bacterium]|jgi:pyruvate kinase
MPNEDRLSWSQLRDELTQLQSELLAVEVRESSLLAAVHPAQRASALNLLHYTELRQRDHWKLQGQLAERGLSSLGRSESHVMASLNAVLGLVDAIARGAREVEPASTDAVTRERGHSLLHEHADRLLGAPNGKRRARIMVTLPSECAHSTELVQQLVAAGMDCARINAAHDDRAAWEAMARNVRDAAQALGRRCMVAVDLPGPKCRTGALAPGPEVLKLRPRRGPAGDVLEPARAWLTDTTDSRHAPSLPVAVTFRRALHPGDKLSLHDARGRRRRFHVASVVDDAVEILSDRTSYVRSGTVLRAGGLKATIGRLPPLEVPLIVRVGDLLALTRQAVPGGPARCGLDGSSLALAHIPCVPAALLDMVRSGHSVWLDDGKIGGVVEAVSHDAMLVRITAARAEGEQLHAGKGINLPDTETTLPAFTERDVEALAFACETADIVSMSFVRTPEDVRDLLERVEALGRADLGIILKIETREGFDRLPELLLAALQSPRTGVMIARGDLAVECGFERLAEVQEEILWLCEAAHVPVTWATQVLESVAKTGRPTRAEVTDAAMAERAECVMLNKGPYITQAVTLLDDILRRMAAHQDKKSAMFRELRVAGRFKRRMDQLADGGAKKPAEVAP